MVHTKSPEQTISNWVRKSMMAFLEGEKTMPWILGIIRGNEQFALALLQSRLAEYGNADRREELKRALESLIT